MRLQIKPEGEVHAWDFHTGSYCGHAQDSVGIHIPKHGGMALTRKDVITLRNFLNEAIESWIGKPRSMFDNRRNHN